MPVKLKISRLECLKRSFQYIHICIGSLIKSFLTINFNIIKIFFLQVSGLGVLAIGVWSIFWRYHLVLIQVTLTYAVIVYTLLVIGVLITIVNIIGYIGVWKENRCTILYVCIVILWPIIMRPNINYTCETSLLKYLEIKPSPSQSLVTLCVAQKHPEKKFRFESAEGKASKKNFIDIRDSWKGLALSKKASQGS